MDVRSTRFLNRLRADFPVEARLAGTRPAVQDAYGAVLRHWIDHGRAPVASVIDGDHRAVLDRLDLIVATRQGLGCYPFSSAATGIEVVWGRHTVQAMCAIDALAIPMLVKHTCRIAARCGECRTLLEVPVSSGSPPAAAPIKVRYRDPGDAGAAHCSESLCRGIDFVCEACVGSELANLMSLDQASAVARAFFGFQRRWTDKPAIGSVAMGDHRRERSELSRIRNTSPGED